MHLTNVSLPWVVCDAEPHINHNRPSLRRLSNATPHRTDTSWSYSLLCAVLALCILDRTARQFRCPVKSDLHKLSLNAKCPHDSESNTHGYSKECGFSDFYA